MQRTTGPRVSWVIKLALIGVAAATAGTALGQATPTATRTLGLSVFGGYSYVSTDYGTGGSGYLFGADATRPFRSFDVSVEARVGHGTGKSVSENTYEGGLKFGRTYGLLGRFRPYGELQAGYGTIQYKQDPDPGYSHDNSAIYAVGAGVDYGLSTHFALKGDFQYEFWKIGTETSGLTPSSLSIGVVYSIPFHSYRGRRN